jgi:hypothetical protein
MRSPVAEVAWIVLCPRGNAPQVTRVVATIAILFAIPVASCSSSSRQGAGGEGSGKGAPATAAAMEAGGDDDGAVSDGTPTADTWENYAKNFFTTYCTSCHNPQDPTGRDYNLQADVAKDKAAMRCGVASSQDPTWVCGPSPVAKQFPIGNGPKPSDAERARIVAWIVAGEP